MISGEPAESGLYFGSRRCCDACDICCGLGKAVEHQEEAAKPVPDEEAPCLST